MYTKRDQIWDSEWYGLISWLQERGEGYIMWHCQSSKPCRESRSPDPRERKNQREANSKLNRRAHLRKPSEGAGMPHWNCHSKMMNTNHACKHAAGTNEGRDELVAVSNEIMVKEATCRCDMQEEWGESGWHARDGEGHEGQKMREISKEEMKWRCQKRPEASWLWGTGSWWGV